jgi:uncharacterized protein YdeI (YjbR/CyaY-like superfamily)
MSGKGVPARRTRVFRTAAAFRAWLEKNHDRADEVWPLLRRTSAAIECLTYAEALDEALCFGWIDGVRHGCDEETFTNRFTPRKAKSVWSLVNVRHYRRLEAAGRIAPPGAAAWARRDDARTGVYSFENRPRQLAPELEARFRARRRAWAFFEAQPPGYRRLMCFWVQSAKQEATRLKRLDRLIAASAAGERLT